MMQPLRSHRNLTIQRVIRLAQKFTPAVSHCSHLSEKNTLSQALIIFLDKKIALVRRGLNVLTYYFYVKTYFFDEHGNSISTKEVQEKQIYAKKTTHSIYSGLITFKGGGDLIT